MENILEKLASRNQGFNLPYLINLYSEDRSIDLHFVNNTENVELDGVEYLASAFNYIPSAALYGFDGGGVLEITPKEDRLINLVESSSYIFLDVIGTLDEQDDISEIKAFHHKYGSISGNREKITFTYAKDDRPDMTFPSLIWSTQNNRGNS